MENYINIFKQYIIGDFDNMQQYTDEKEKNTNEHPYAKHINRQMTHQIIGLPDNLEGFFLLEESYYDYGNQIILKPHIFYFEPDTYGNVVLHSYKNPTEYTLEEITNVNKDFKVNYKDLVPSDTFNPMTYYYGENKIFSGESVTDLGSGKRFTLKEQIGSDTLSVLELLEIEGKRVTKYNTPIIYKRIRRNSI